MGVPVTSEEMITFSETHLFSPTLLFVIAVLLIVGYIIWRLLKPFAGKDHQNERGSE